MESQIVALILTNNTFLISKIEEIGADLGQPDCKLINPYVINSELNLTPWLEEITKNDDILISSDKILTIVEPKKTLLDKYLELTQ